tara:strand:- start:211 stop:477 length:267 start_codon:yes stop_codon:yes gene_type:complete
MKCKCGFEVEEEVALKHGCLMCGDKSFVDLLKLATITNNKKNNAKYKDICYKGKCQGLKIWSVELDMNYSTLNGRRFRGLSVEEMFKK